MYHQTCLPISVFFNARGQTDFFVRISTSFNKWLEWNEQWFHIICEVSLYAKNYLNYNIKYNLSCFGFRYLLFNKIIPCLFSNYNYFFYFQEYNVLNKFNGLSNYNSFIMFLSLIIWYDLFFLIGYKKLRICSQLRTVGFFFLYRMIDRGCILFQTVSAFRHNNFFPSCM